MTKGSGRALSSFVVFSFDIPSSLVGHSTEFVISPSGAQLAPSYPVTRPRTGRAGISPDRGDLGTVPPRRECARRGYETVRSNRDRAGVWPGRRRGGPRPDA